MDASDARLTSTEAWRRDVAGDGIETGSTVLSQTPMPPLSQIDAMAEFEASSIDAADFEAASQQALEWFEL